MKVAHVFLKSIAQQFYRDHSGVFLVVFFFVAGFMRAEEHIRIAKMAISSLPVLLLIFLLWAIYFIRVVFYIKAQTNKVVNGFLKVSGELIYGKQLFTWVLVQIAICAPIVFYAGFICSIGIESNSWMSFTYIVAVVLAGLTIPLFYYIHLIKRFLPERQTGNLFQWLDSHFVKPFPLWFIQHLLKGQPLTFLLSKSLVFIVLSAFFALNNSGDYDWRVIAVGVVFGLIGNLTIIDSYHRFENEQLELFRSFPIKAVHRLKYWTITFSLLIIPEAIVLVRYFSIDHEVDKLVGLVVLQLTFPLAVMAYQHMDNVEREELIKAGASFVMLFFFLTMFSIHPLILSLLCVVLTAGILSRYYRYISG